MKDIIENSLKLIIPDFMDFLGKLYLVNFGRESINGVSICEYSVYENLVRVRLGILWESGFSICERVNLSCEYNHFIVVLYNGHLSQEKNGSNTLSIVLLFPLPRAMSSIKR